MLDVRIDSGERELNGQYAAAFACGEQGRSGSRFVGGGVVSAEPVVGEPDIDRGDECVVVEHASSCQAVQHHLGDPQIYAVEHTAP